MVEKRPAGRRSSTSEARGPDLGSLSQNPIMTDEEEARRPGDVRPWQYDDWTAALCDHYFPYSMAGAPVIFLVDEEELAAIHPSSDAETAVESLAAVVRPRLTPGHHNGTFSRFERDGRAWRLGDNTDQLPPFLPLLAVCVLAASRMGAGAVHGANYRRPLADLLALAGDRIPPGYGDTIPLLWRYLQWWLDDRLEGARGRSTIVEDRRLANIGFAISQTLFRSADQARLAEFFRWIDLEPGEQISGAELLAYFRVWAPARGLSAGAQHMLTSADYSEALERILAGHAARWDGTRIPGSSDRQARVLLVLRAFPRLSAELLCPQPEGFPRELEVRGPRGQALLEASADGWYDEVPLAIDERLLLDGAFLDGGRFSFRMPGGAVHVLRLDEHAGGWCAVDQLRPGVRHWVLAHEHVWSDVMTLLRGHADEAKEDERARQLLPRWRLLRDVILDSPSAGPVRDELRCLVPTVRNRVALDGGLRLQRGTDVYLVGGEPNLWLPGDEAETSVRAQVDGRDLAPDGAVVRLAQLEPALDPGEHTIEVPGALRRRFHTVPSSLVLARPDVPVRHLLRLSADGRVVAHVAARRADQAGDVADVSIAGALVEGRGAPERGSRPVLLRRAARRTIVLGALPGEREVIASAPPAPRWMERWGLSDRLFEHTPAFDAVWVIQEWQTPPLRRARAVVHVEPVPSLEPPDVWSAWAREFLDEADVVPEDLGLWRLYRERAAAVAG